MTNFPVQRKDVNESCDIHFAYRISFVIAIFETASHLILISGERYLAIKQTSSHDFLCYGVDHSPPVLSWYFVFS